MQRLGFKKEQCDRPRSGVENNRNRIYTYTYSREELEDIVENKESFFQLSLPDNINLTLGQTYHWGRRGDRPVGEHNACGAGGGNVPRSPPRRRLRALMPG